MVRPDARWELFCKVVDNFGDIGVCWRLARALAEQHGLHIRLWVDDLRLAQRFAGDGHPAIDLQHWQPDSDFSDLSPVVIETFGCGLPPACQAVMRARNAVWVNVDYLSAEPWVADFHARPSPQANGLVRHYFYPGFDAQTGGLLREAGLPALQASASWSGLGLQAADDSLHVSLFCYPHAPVQALLDSLCQGPQPVRVYVTAPLAATVAQALQLQSLPHDSTLRKQQAEFVVLPFFSQDDYDRLLYLCDLNFVRGEDSWIRALWAAKPMIWLPYLQSEETHLDKLNAFLQVYLQGVDDAVASAWQASMQAWAHGNWQAADWQALQANLPQMARHARSFAQRLSLQADLATNLVIFIEKCHAHRV